jgi:hypothetical protein
VRCERLGERTGIVVHATQRVGDAVLTVGERGVGRSGAADLGVARDPETVVKR